MDRARTPTSSVVIAAYDAGATIEQAIASVLLQTRADFELIVVDDGSTDDTAARVAPFTRDHRVHLHRQPNAGPAAARNAGIERASGRYISTLDSDDLWLPGYLEDMVEALERSPSAGFAFTRAWVLERATNRFRRKPWSPQARSIDSPEDLFRALIERNFVFNAVTSRREALEETGAYDPKLRTCEDYELWLRIAASGYTAEYVPGPLCICSDRAGSLSHDDRQMLLGLHDTYAKVLSVYRLDPDEVNVVAAQLLATGHRLALVDGRVQSPARTTARRALARATAGLRRRRARSSHPPPEVAEAFSGAASPRAPSAPDDRLTRGLVGTVIRGATVAGAGYVITQVISLAVYLVLARLLAPRDFGVFAAATVPVGLGLVVGESGMLAALIQRHDRIEEAFNSAFVASLLVGITLAIGGVAAAPLVGLLFNSFRAGLIAAVMAGTILVRTALIVPSAWLQRTFSVVRRAVIDPLGTLTFAAAAIASAATGCGPWSLVIGTYAQLVLEVLAAWGLVRWRPRLSRATIPMWRELARFGRPVFIANLIRRATAEAPVLAVGSVLGQAPLGQYSYALRVAIQPISAIVDVGAYVLLPALARIAPDEERFRAAVLRALRWTCAIAFPLGLLLVPLGSPAVVLVFGAQWRAAGHAVMALGVYCAALGLDSIASETWKAAARTDMLPRMHGLALVLTAVFVGALVPFGLNAVTIGMALAAVSQAAYAAVGIGKVAHIPWRALIAELWPPAAAAAAMVVVLFAAERGLLHSDRRGVAVGLCLLAAETVLGAAVYLACLSALSQKAPAALLRTLRTLFARAVGTGRWGALVETRPHGL